ncbi:MAG: hypothetical protein QME05_04360 [Candidatus Margulisbacteria bacterium]|nr:hypothetical protein [Candidatus Margulisiibacteriota bacterium]
MNRVIKKMNNHDDITRCKSKCNTAGNCKAGCAAACPPYQGRAPDAAQPILTRFVQEH